MQFSIAFMLGLTLVVAVSIPAAWPLLKNATTPNPSIPFLSQIPYYTNASRQRTPDATYIEMTTPTIVTAETQEALPIGQGNTNKKD